MCSLLFVYRVIITCRGDNTGQPPFHHHPLKAQRRNNTNQQPLTKKDVLTEKGIRVEREGMKKDKKYISLIP